MNRESQPQFMEHEKLLFRWVGRDIEGRGKSKENGELPQMPLGTLTGCQREEYLERIEQALNPNQGLYAKVPDEFLGGPKAPWKPTLFCLSFTELSLAATLDHCRLYGRLGFGFTKQAILKRSGRPVAYIPGGVSDPSVKRLLAIERAFVRCNGPGIGQAKGYFEYLRHFYKRMRFPVVQQDPDTMAPKPAVAKAPRKAPNRYELMKFPASRPFPYLEEQEWRIVISRPEKYKKAPGEEPAVWFPMHAGRELMVMVVPDNLILHQVLARKSLRERALKAGRPPIQVISWEAIRRI